MPGLTHSLTHSHMYLIIISVSVETNERTTEQTDSYIHCTYIYIYRRGGCGGPAFWQPTIFSGFVCFERLCVGFCVSWTLVWCACMHVFVSSYNISFNCFKPGGLFTNTGFVYKHCVSVYRAFSVLSLLDLLVVFYVHYMLLNSCLLVLYVLLVVCLFVFIFICCDVAGKRWRRGGGGWRRSPAPPPLPPPSPQQHQHRATDSNQQVHKPHLTANLAH